MKLTKLAALALLLAPLSVAAQQSVKIEANIDTKHKVGAVEELDRSKFVVIHSTITQRNWATNNVGDKDYRVHFLNKYDVYCGRSTGGVTTAFRTVKEDPNKPGFPSLIDLKKMGEKSRQSYVNNRDEYKRFEPRAAMILCAQEKIYPTGEVINPKSDNPWAISTTDTAEEPFGTATGVFYANYLKEFYSDDPSEGTPKPKYCEIVNEPLWPLVDWTKGKPKEDLTRIFRFHSNVAREIKKVVTDVPVGGYCTAFPNFETNNFERWDQRWKHFIDVAGADMDFWTVHLYDFPCIGGKQKYRKGSNMEATMDMLEHYSYLKLGTVKPLLVSEFGAQVHDYNKKPYIPYASWLKVKSELAQVMQFMARPNNICSVIPYHMIKMEWHKAPSSSRLFMRENEPEEYTGKYIFSHNVHFYQLLAGINGVRVDVTSSDLDIQCDGYVDKNKAYILVNSLSFEDKMIDLNIFGSDAEPKRVTMRRHYLTGGKDGMPVLDETQITNFNEPQKLTAEATTLFIIEYKKPVKITKLNDEVKYYAKTYLQPITAAKATTFEMDMNKSGKYGEATLRLGVGRDHGRSLTPKVVVNGKEIKVQENSYRGDEQKQRDTFFGVLEIPVSYDLLSDKNKIEVTFPDEGGYISTCVMQLYNFSDNIRNN